MGEKNGKKEASKRNEGTKRKWRTRRTRNDRFYLIRVYGTRLAVHLNMITEYKAVSKVVCGKLVRGNWIVLQNRVLRLLRYGYCSNMLRGNGRNLFVTRRFIITSNTNSTEERISILTVIYIYIFFFYTYYLKNGIVILYLGNAEWWPSRNIEAYRTVLQNYLNWLLHFN